MAKGDRKVMQAWLEAPNWGLVELAHDWKASYLPPVSLGPHGPRFTTFAKLPEPEFARVSGYCVDRKGDLHFILFLERAFGTAEVTEAVYVAGSFNGWQHAVGQAEWQLSPGKIGQEAVLRLSVPADRVLGQAGDAFKFVTASHRWLEVQPSAPNAVRDDTGNVNYRLDPARTGHHLFRFTLLHEIDLSAATSLYWNNVEAVPLRPGDFFFSMRSDAPLGTRIVGGETVFRLFAPRAQSVELCVCDRLELRDQPHRYALARCRDGVWEIALEGNLHGWFYWYHVSGPTNSFSHFEPRQQVLDPYAFATVDHEGPGIVIDLARVGRPARGFQTPAWQDLVIVEAHVRDLATLAPLELPAAERGGFRALKAWVESPHFYLHELGVNAVELQPVQEFDNRTREEYHWGYMPTNYFSPESSYSSDPVSAAGIRELQDLVAAFHRRGMAVILDVVYNHVGEPAHLVFIDKLYYFETDAQGRLSNWSGCGNDLRASSAMAARLIIDSCIHLMDTYGVDGFRFDLAELLGKDVLRQIEKALKRAKSDVILIAEPWSFRGHIAGQLSDTGWASWNDGYRNFLREFVRGGGTRETYEYFLKGSPWHFAKWPAQTVNYTESHDDRTWIDMITERPDGNGFHPTPNDRRRTHLMAAVLFSSIGIPMLSAGQDFLRSKHGVNNTYLRGDLNALDYRRIHRFPGTHAYFAGWIHFRRSEAGRLLRLFSKPTDTYFQFFFAQDSTAAATLYNADGSLGARRLLFAVNPTFQEVTIPLPRDVAGLTWVQLANHERFEYPLAMRSPQPVEPGLILGPLACGLWMAEAPGV
ncbi:alpha-amylase family glycosyl hydrolase [Nibricoccus sp. IMCC34717]|uniref:alpha-amylase family glycosyl hydrolase n=1 Tax=Nibricoccus sp. IMCC34717 TaxID=3034021 RepID=UPI003850511F